MKFPSICFVLAIAIFSSQTTSVHGQESGDAESTHQMQAQKLARMQATIDALQAELQSLKAEQNTLPTPVLLAPTDSVAPAVPPTERQAPSALPNLRNNSINDLPQNMESPSTYPIPHSAANYYHGNYERNYQGGVRRSTYSPYGTTYFEEGRSYQPAAGFVEYGFVPEPGFGYGGYGGFGSGYPGGGIQIGPYGWSVGFGNLHFEFNDRWGHHNGHRGNGHRGHKKHDKRRYK